MSGILSASRRSAGRSAWAHRTAPSWRRSAMWRRACTPSASRRAGPPPASLTGPRAGLRPRRPGHRRGRPDARRPAGPAAPAGELPAGHGHHADAMGAAGGVAAGLRRALRCGRPSLLPFVTRPAEQVLDRAALGLATPGDAASGRLPAARPARHRRRHCRATGERRDLRVRAGGAAPARARAASTRGSTTWRAPSSSPRCPRERRRSCSPRSTPARPSASPASHCPRSTAGSARRGLEASLHPYRKGHYLGSGQGDVVLAEAGLDGESQYRAVRATSTSEPARQVACLSLLIASAIREPGLDGVDKPAGGRRPRGRLPSRTVVPSLRHCPTARGGGDGPPPPRLSASLPKGRRGTAARKAAPHYSMYSRCTGSRLDRQLSPSLGMA